MKAAATMALAALAMSALAVPSAAQTASDLPTRPLGAVRSLHHMQDQIATGDTSAFQVQSSTLRIIDRLFAGIDTGTLAQPEQRHAVLAYAVSGGNPSTFAGLYEALARQTDGESEKAIAEAVAAALLGRSVSDDPRAAPLAIGGMLGAGLALLNGINADGNDAQIAHLSDAVLLAPGTLVEESALRRLMALHAQAGDHGRFLTAASRYARTFVASPYASDFAAALVAGGVGLRNRSDHERLAEIIDFMPVAHRRSIVARQMRAATVAGNFELVRFLEARFVAEIEARQAAIAGAETPPPDPAETLRQRLYALMANIATADHRTLAEELDAIEDEALPPADRQLLEVARAVVREMTRPGPGATTAPPRDGSRAAISDPVAGSPAEPREDGAFDLPLQPEEDQVRTILPGYGVAADPVAAEPPMDAPAGMPEATSQRAQPGDEPRQDETMPPAHRDFVTNAKDLLRDVESVLEERGR